MLTIRYFSFSIFVISLLTFIYPAETKAQRLPETKANFDLASRFTPQKLRKLSYDTRVNPNWIDNSDMFWYKFKTSSGTNYYIVDPVKKSKTALFNNEKMASEITKIINKPVNSKELPVKSLKFVKNSSKIEFKIDSLLFNFDLNTQILEKVRIETIPKTPDWVRYSPDSTKIIYAKNHDLYMMNAGDKDSTEYRLTFDGEINYSYASDENDTSKVERKRASVTWFKDSKKFYIIRDDQRKMESLFLINSTSKPRPKLETYKFTMPGEKHAPQSEMYIFNAETREGKRIAIEKWIDQELGGTYAGPGFFFGKTPDKLYAVRRDRTWRKLDLCRIDAESGEVEVLVSEETKPYFNFMNMRFAELNDGEEFIWWAERDNWGHLYLYDNEGNLKNQITKGPFLAFNIAAVDTLKRTMYFYGYGVDKSIYPYDQRVYKINLDGSGMGLLTPEDGFHNVNFSESKKYFVDNYSQADIVPKSVLKDNAGIVIMELENADTSQLESSGWRLPERFSVKAADGVTDLYGVMWKPFDFIPGKSYPIIVNVYPGPQSEPFPSRFTSTSRNYALSQLGFIVVAVGNRGGSPLRSKWYHNYGYGNLRDYGLEDIKGSIEQLAARHKYIDMNKVGIYGHSGGGFMSTAAMLVYPDFFKVAVSSSGNHDNNIYSKWWSEMHHGVEEEIEKKKNDEGEEIEETVFKIKVPTNPEIAKNLKGHLLITTGDMDNNVHPANTIRLADALIKANKRFDFMIFPGKRHGYGDYSRYFERMMFYYFAEHLLGDYRNNVEMFDNKKN